MNANRSSEAEVHLDAPVLSQIYREHYVALRRFAVRALRDSQEAEDVVQETLLKIWNAAPEITGSMRGYLFATARNIIIDRHRRATARIVPDLLGEADPEAIESTQVLSQALDRILLEEALMHLSLEHRQVVLHMHYYGSTVAQTAHDLQIPEGTVKSRGYYALRSLRSILHEMGVDQ